MTNIGNHEINTVPIKIAINAGKTEFTTDFSDLLNTALAK
jgi:hypothetical protein